MSSGFALRMMAVVFVVGIGAAAMTSCGSVTPASDGGAAGASAGSGGGSSGSAGTGGSTGIAGTTGSGGSAGRGGASGGDGGVLSCSLDVSGDCPTGFTCACGGAGPVGTCTCHRNCTDTNQCPAAEPMCGCPGSTGAGRFCVNACFCSCN